ncbi:hypothetical protein HCN56_20405, partial [Streptomyces lonarensis]|nr:hypothetical protein [Streptomyces lonarensis]
MTTDRIPPATGPDAPGPAVERGEFLVEYQPIVSLADDTVRGVEALV